MESPASHSSVPMKWHKALTWVLLFLSALYFIWNGVLLLLDAAFDLSGMTDLFQAGPSAGRLLFLVFGLIYLGLALLSVHTRFQLAQFAPNGPTLLGTLLLTGSIATLVFSAAFSKLAEGTIHFSLKALCILAAGIVLFILNRIYYNKRADLFREDEE